MSRARLALIRRTVGTAALAALTILIVPGAWATTVDVFPGAGTLQAAIDAAPDGAQLAVHPGLYTGAVVVTKPLKIECKHDATNDGGCTIDAECGAAVALDIAADGVAIKLSRKKILGARGGPFLVRRGTATVIRVAGRQKVKLTEVQVSGFVVCGTEQIGIDVSGTSSNIKLTSEYADTGALAKFRISGVPADSKIKFKNTQTAVGMNETGILIENSGSGAVLGKSGIVLKGGQVGLAAPNATGIRLVNSDGVSLISYRIVANPNPDTPLVGINLDAMSDNNLLLKNVWFDPEADETAYIDNGSGNCGSGNNFTVPACP